MKLLTWSGSGHGAPPDAADSNDLQFSKMCSKNGERTYSYIAR